MQFDFLNTFVQIPVVYYNNIIINHHGRPTDAVFHIFSQRGAKTTGLEESSIQDDLPSCTGNPLCLPAIDRIHSRRQFFH